MPATKPSNWPNAVVCKFARPQAKEKVMTGDLWNEIPYEYKDFLEKSLKKETKRALLSILETEDSAMEPDKIMLIQTG